MTESELLDRLVLHVRTKNFDGFCSAVESGLITFGQKKLLYIMHNDLLKNINDCFVVYILDPSQSMDEFLHSKNVNLILKNFCAQQNC